MRKLPILIALFAAPLFAANDGVATGTPGHGSSGCKFSNCLISTSDSDYYNLPDTLLGAISSDWTIDYWASTTSGGTHVLWSFGGNWLG